MDEEDPFDMVASEHHNYYNTGREEGERLGEEIAAKDAYDNGLKSGADLADEIGYYMGITETLKRNANLFKSYIDRKDKIDKLFDDLSLMLITLDTSDASDPALPDNVTKIRTKFKMLTSLLKMRTLNTDKDF